MLSFFLALTADLVADNNDSLALQDAAPLIDSIPSAPPGDYGAAFVKMFLTLIALIFLLGISFWFLKKIIQQRLQKGNAQSSIQILEKRMISPKTMLYLIEIEGKKTVIAESHLEIKAIHSLPEEK